MDYTDVTKKMPIAVSADLRRLLQRRFPVVVVEELPWLMFDEAAERTCRQNHGQTLEEVRERCGLSASEAVRVICGIANSRAEIGDEESCHRVLYVMKVMFNRGGVLALRGQHPVHRAETHSAPPSETAGRQGEGQAAAGGNSLASPAS